MLLLLCCVANELLMVRKTRPDHWRIRQHFASSSMDPRPCFRGEGGREKTRANAVCVTKCLWLVPLEGIMISTKKKLPGWILQIPSRPLGQSVTLWDRETGHRDKAETKDCQGRNKTKTTNKWSLSHCSSTWSIQHTTSLTFLDIIYRDIIPENEGGLTGDHLNKYVVVFTTHM